MILRWRPLWEENKLLLTLIDCHRAQSRLQSLLLHIGVLDSYFKGCTLRWRSGYGNHNPYLPDTAHREWHASKVGAIALLTGIDAIGAHIHRLHVTLDQNMSIGDQLLSGRVHNLEREVGWSRESWRIRHNLERDTVGTSLHRLDGLGRLKQCNDGLCACAYPGYDHEATKAKGNNE